MASNIPVIVQGNSFNLAIPLQIYVINGDQMELQDYTPDPTDQISIQLKGSRRNYTYTPTSVTDNVCMIALGGYELADNYSVVVSIVKANGQRLRSFRTDQFFIVESSDDLTQDDIIQGLEENVIYLNSSIFVAGADGRGISSIIKTSTSGLVDTYTITYSDSTTSTFNVTNGAQGEPGATISSVEKTATAGKVDTYTITMTNGSTFTFQVTNGMDGVDLGLANIVNDLTTGGATNVLSAEMGKVLGEGVFEITEGSTETITPALEQGGLSGTNGHKYPSTDSNHLKRVRTVDFVQIQGSATFTINSGYMFNVFKYSAADEDTYIGNTGAWNTTYTLNNFNGYIYLIIKNTDGTNITPSGIVATVVRSVSGGMVRRIADNLTTQRTDYGLSANQGVVLGGMVNGNNLTPTLEQGGMLTSNGTKDNSTALFNERIRTADMIPINGLFTLALPTGYKMNVFFYSSNDFGTYTGNAGGWQGASYSGTYNGYIMAVIAHDDATQEIEPTDTTLAFASVGLEQRVSELEEQLPNPLTYNREYYGELIKIGRNKFKESVYTTLPTFSGYTGLHQCMAVYGDYVLLFTYNTSDATQPAKAYLYRLSTSTQLAALTLPNSTYKRPHCNSATFSEVFNTSDSILPLLYVSQWDNDSQKGCFVYDIKLINGTYSVDLVQTILPTNVSAATLGAGQTDWCVDPIGYIYCIGYLLNDGATIEANNKTMITKFALPKVSDGVVVTFGDDDVLDHFDVPIFIYRQDLCFENGRIFMVSGVSSSIPAKLTIISPDDKRVVSEVSLAYNTNEPEGIGVTDGKLLMGWRNDAKLYRLEFD